MLLPGQQAVRTGGDADGLRKDSGVEECWDAVVVYGTAGPAAFLIGTAFVFGLAASSIAVAAGALSRWPSAFRILPFAVVVVGLGSVTMMAVSASWEIVREVSRGFAADGFWMMVFSILIATVAGMILCAMVGASALAHPYENRSTPFRVFALTALVAGAVWMAFLIRHFAARFVRSPPDAEVQWGYAVTAAAILAIFCIFAATEEERLTPRMRERVPRRASLALLVTPLLPGAGRGMLFTVLLAALALLLPLGLGTLFGFPPADREIVGLAIASWLYVVFYAGVAALVRIRLGGGGARNWLARATLPVLLMAGVLLPLLFEVIVHGRAQRGWHFYEILNPFHTLNHYLSKSRTPFEVLPALLILTGVVLLFLLPVMARGVRDVLAASAERRNRAS